jgi:small redox-active disulfide protein 2
MEIKILGTGCPKCQQTEKNVRKIILDKRIDARIEKITDSMKIAGHGVFVTPAVIVDGKVKSVGKIPDKAEISTWFER